MVDPLDMDPDAPTAIAHEAMAVSSGASIIASTSSDPKQKKKRCDDRVHDWLQSLAALRCRDASAWKSSASQEIFVLDQGARGCFPILWCVDHRLD